MNAAAPQAADAAKSKANALSMQMYNLIGIVKLAAFAAEARRTLDGIRDVTDYRVDIKQAIADSVSAMGDWRSSLTSTWRESCSTQKSGRVDAKGVC